MAQAELQVAAARSEAQLGAGLAARLLLAAQCMLTGCVFVVFAIVFMLISPILILNILQVSVRLTTALIRKRLGALG